MRKKVFISKVLQMTFAMIGFNISGLLYNVFISNTLGAETIGLFHLVGSVYSIGISLCVSGMSLTCTRLLSDMPRQKGLMCSDSILLKCLTISLVTSLVATLLLYGFSDLIATSLLGRSEASRYLKTLCSGRQLRWLLLSHASASSSVSSSQEPQLESSRTTLS